MGYLRGVVSGEEESGKEGKEVKTEFAEEWSRLEAEKVRLREERATQQVVEWKRQGRLRATERAEGLARALLVSGEESLVRFDGESVSLRTLFAAFMQENGHVVPMGEWIVADRLGTLGHSEGSAARERLIGLAQEKAGKEGLGYVQAFTAVATAHPDLAQAAREE